MPKDSIPGRARLRRAATLICASAVLIAGCDAHRSVDRIWIEVVDSETSRPITEAEVALFDLDASRYVLNLAVDSQGVAELRPEVPGTYVPVIRARGYAVFAMPRDRYVLERHGRILHATIPLRPARISPDLGDRLGGRVIDATSGEPIPRAQIEMTDPREQNPNFSEYRGDRGASEVLSDQDGRFLVDTVPMQPIALGEEPVTTSLRVRAAGYRSRSLGGWPRDRIPIDLTIALEPGQDDGVITGRVVDLDGEPVAGVGVRAEWRVGPDARFRAVPSASGFEEEDPQLRFVLLAGLGVSDASGRFLLAGMPRGRFSVAAAPESQDGFWSPGRTGIELPEDRASVDAGDLVVAPALRLNSPTSGFEVGPDQQLNWEAIDGAAGYLVSLERGDGAFASAHVEVPIFAIRETQDFVQSGAWYAWRVIALDDRDGALAASERAWLFRLASP